jgi:DNA repair protein RecO (recombination protein O)
MSQTHHLQGFVLFRENKGENDLIISFYSRQSGKIQILVRGGRKINSKLNPILAEPFSLLDLVVVQGKIYHLIGGEKRQRFPQILSQPEKLITLNFLFGQINKIIKPEPDKKIFSLLVKFLIIINQAKKENSLLLINAFLIKFLSFLGYCPEIKKCLICGKLPLEENLLFNFNKGGIVCLKHTSLENLSEANLKIKQKDLKILQKLLYQDFNSLLKQSFFQKDLKRAELIIKKFFIWHLGT